MANIKIYTWTVCPFCERSKALLQEKGVDYEEVNLDGKDDELIRLREETGMRTIPQIFVNDKFIGGFSELSEMNASGELDKALKA